MLVAGLISPVIVCVLIYWIVGVVVVLAYLRSALVPEEPITPRLIFAITINATAWPFWAWAFLALLNECPPEEQPPWFRSVAQWWTSPIGKEESATRRRNQTFLT